MPIFVYEPVIENESDDEVSVSRECCHFEVLQWTSEPPLTACPQCGGAIRRALTEFSSQVRNSASLSRSAPEIRASNVAGPVREQASSLISADGNSAASRAARLAYKHVCGKNCRH